MTGLVTTADVCLATGASFRQIDYWATRGYITPTQATTRHAVPQPVRVGAAESPEDALRSPGSGHVRYWSDTEVRVVARMVALIGDGLTPPCAARLARELVQDGSARLSVGTLIPDAAS